jgi:hypothetical protein
MRYEVVHLSVKRSGFHTNAEKTEISAKFLRYDFKEKIIDLDKLARDQLAAAESENRRIAEKAELERKVAEAEREKVLALKFGIFKTSIEYRKGYKFIIYDFIP